jgi:hypothetical protein
MKINIFKACKGHRALLVCSQRPNEQGLGAGLGPVESGRSEQPSLKGRVSERLSALTYVVYRDFRHMAYGMASDSLLL